MTRLHFGVARGLSPGAALRRGAGLLDTVSPATPALLFGAAPAGGARVLGRWQRRATLTEGAGALRRATGGPAASLGDGVAYLALALRHRSVLLDTPADRLLNRLVRGLLAGLRRHGFAAHYFGREWVTVNKRPAGLLGWARRPDGRVLLEAFLALEAPFALPQDELTTPPRVRFLGKPPLTLSAAGGPPRLEALVEACAAGWGGADVVAELPAAEEGALPPDLPAVPRWSPPLEVPIGFVQAGLAVNDDGDVERALLAGDVYQDDDGPELLSAALTGGPASEARVRSAVDAAYGPGAAVLEGVKGHEAVVEALRGA